MDRQGDWTTPESGVCHAYISVNLPSFMSFASSLLVCLFLCFGLHLTTFILHIHYLHTDDHSYLLTFMFVVYLVNL